MKEIVLGIWLVVQGGIDYKHKEIPLWISILGGVIGVFFCIIEKRSFSSVLSACILGVLMLGFSWLTKEVIGYGDGIILIVMGLYLTISQLISIGMMAFCVAGVVALLLLVLFKKNGSYRIPFIPFLAIAYGIQYLIEHGAGMR